MKPVHQELDEKLVELSPTRLRARQGRAKVCQLAHSSAQVDAQKKILFRIGREPSPNIALGETIAQDRGQTACGPTRCTCLCRACLFLIAKPRPHGQLSFQYCESFESFSFNRLWHDPTQHFPIFSLLGWETVLYIINFPFLKNLGYFLQCGEQNPSNQPWLGGEFHVHPIKMYAVVLQSLCCFSTIISFKHLNISIFLGLPHLMIFIRTPPCDARGKVGVAVAAAQWSALGPQRHRYRHQCVCHCWLMDSFFHGNSHFGSLTVANFHVEKR